MASDIHVQAEIALRNAHNLERWHFRRTYPKPSIFSRDMRPVEDRLRWYTTEMRLLQARSMFLKPQAF